MTAHACPGDDCPRCQTAIDEHENPPPPADTDWRQAQDDYERWLFKETA